MAKLLRGWKVQRTSGAYSAWYFLAPGYRVTDTGWVNIMQWKEQYPCAGFCSDPSWYIVLAPSRPSDGTARSDWPVAQLVSWEQHRPRRPVRRPVPVGRWFQIRAELRQRHKLTVWIDGRRLDVGRQEDYPVGLMHGSRSLSWEFGVGNYSGTGGGAPSNAVNGPMYVDDVRYRPFPRRGASHAPASRAAGSP
jgi:hypothetical protein